MFRSLLLVSLLTAFIAPLIQAGEDGPKKKDAPAFPPVPKVVPTAPPPMIIVMPYQQRTDTREVWQYYAPNRMGRMVPRVIVTPYGSLYSRTLQPYPWAGVNPSAILPIVVD